ncbi:MAG: alpha/beta hydrolase-fold protein [Bacteroidota bacterium]
MFRKTLMPCLFLVCLLIACTTEKEPESRTGSVTILFQIEVPDDTPAVYITGNLPALGPWQPDALALEGTGSKRTVNVQMPRDHALEYKFTLGSWDREAVDAAGSVMPNFQLTASNNATTEHTLEAFKQDPLVYLEDWQSAGILGSMVAWPDVASAFLTAPRHVQIWLPPEYESQPARSFPVLYMHDGQNLFDPRTAGMGVDWGVDEAMVKGANAGLFERAIVVGVWNSGRRLEEYSPWHEANQYARFLKEELIPRVNQSFRTQTEAANTFVMGSSMGGLLSYYLVKEHPDTFSACGCVSTHFPLSEAVADRILLRHDDHSDTTPFILRDMEAGATIPAGTRFFFDYGTEGLDASYGPTHEAVEGWLNGLGLVSGQDFLNREYEGADHNEASWRARLQDQLVWMLAD